MSTISSNNNNKDVKKTKHRKFTAEEDKKLKSAISVHGTSDWMKIASLMEGRNSRQCRERWLNYLSPKLNNSEWTKEEDQFLLEKINEMGKLWVQIAKYFPGRTDQMMKNRYNKLKREDGTTKKRKPRVVRPLKKAYLIKFDLKDSINNFDFSNLEAEILHSNYSLIESIFSDKPNDWFLNDQNLFLPDDASFTFEEEDKFLSPTFKM